MIKVSLPRWVMLIFWLISFAFFLKNLDCTLCTIWFLACNFIRCCVYSCEKCVEIIKPSPLWCCCFTSQRKIRGGLAVKRVFLSSNSPAELLLCVLTVVKNDRVKVRLRCKCYEVLGPSRWCSMESIIGG